MIPIPLFEKFGSQSFVTSIKVRQITRYSSKPNNLKTVNTIKRVRGTSSSKTGNLQYQNQNHRVYHKVI